MRRKLLSSLGMLLGVCSTIVLAGLLQSCAPTGQRGMMSSFSASSTNTSNNTNTSTKTRGINKKVALVIGNNSYIHSPLNNPVNDATDIANALRNIGFSVSLKTDLNKQTLESATRTFGQEAQGANVALLYFSGHGLQVHGENIIAPTDYQGSRPDGTPDGVSANTIQKIMQDATGGTKILILDACRNDPNNKVIEQVAARSVRGFRGEGKGLAPMVPMKEFIIMYATAAGETASDGNGRNSPYTSALLKYIKEPIPIETLFKRVAATVAQTTQPPQWPANYTAGLTSDFCFTGCGIEDVVNASNSCRINIGRGIYEGECADGKAQGEGVQRYADGEYYVGSFQANLRHGFGKQFLIDGTEISGRWDNGRLVSSR